MSIRPARISLLALALACGPGVPGDTTVTAGTTTANATTSGAVTTGTAEALTTGLSSSVSTSAIPPDLGAAEVVCDVWKDDCPAGWKCAPYSSDGDDILDSHKCVPIDRDPGQFGDECLSRPVGEGGDTCGWHLMCWSLGETGKGMCVPLCIGSPEQPTCADPALTCIIPKSGIPALCFPECDPIEQDCVGDDRCLPQPPDYLRFGCFLDVQFSDGLFAPCEFLNQCAPGLVCVEPQRALECDAMAAGCCLPFCDTDLPNTCPGVDQECVPWYDDPADAAPFNVDVGLCQLPGPP